MKISTAALDALRVGFQQTFQSGLAMATALSSAIATEIPSSTKEERMGWIGKMPNVREWIGDRVVQNFGESDYTIKNKDWELTIGVSRNDIDDDTLGLYKPMFEEMGQSTIGHKELLIFNLLKAGFSTNCWDGQFFFDTDHPVLDANGVLTTYANTDGGAGTPWFLVSSNRAVKPIVWTNRKPWQFVARDRVDDSNVFRLKEFQYGVDARYNVGYGFPQMSWGSKQTLDGTSYGTARAAIQNMKGDYGRPLGLVPDLLVVPPALESAGLKLLNSEYGAGGVTNEWKGTAKLLVVPWLA